MTCGLVKSRTAVGGLGEDDPVHLAEPRPSKERHVRNRADARHADVAELTVMDTLGDLLGWE